MLKDKIIDLFKDYDDVTRQIIAEVLILEWQKLSEPKPRGVTEKIRDIIDAEARLKDED